MFLVSCEAVTITGLGFECFQPQSSCLMSKLIVVGLDSRSEIQRSAGSRGYYGYYILDGRPGRT